jgi:hypothetical protein
MAPGGAEFGLRADGDDCADDDVLWPLGAPRAHPVNPDKLAAMTTVPHTRGR